MKECFAYILIVMMLAVCSSCSDSGKTGTVPASPDIAGNKNPQAAVAVYREPDISGYYESPYPAEEKWDATGEYQYRLSYKDTAIIIDSFAFTDHLVIPETLDGIPVTAIAEKVFEDKDRFVSVSIPDGVVYIGSQAFRDCSSLASVSIPDSVVMIEDYAFAGCDKLTGFVFPEKVKVIRKKVLSGCRSLASVFIPENVTAIEEEAFSYCESLESVHIPAIVERVEPGAFIDCISLQDIRLSPVNPYLELRDGALFNKSDSSLVFFTPSLETEEYVIPNGTEVIGKGTFYRCKNLVSISIPDTVVTIGNMAFAYCKSLRDVVIPKSTTQLGFAAFYDCESLTDIVIPKNVERIEGELFSDCLALSNVIIEDGIVTIGPQAFFFTNTKSLRIPESVTYIGPNALAYNPIVVRGSYAEQYCIENRITCRYADEVDSE